MSDFFEIFNPGQRFTREQLETEKLLVVNEAQGGTGPKPLDLDSGSVVLRLPASVPASPDAEPTTPPLVEPVEPTTPPLVEPTTPPLVEPVETTTPPQQAPDAEPDAPVG